MINILYETQGGKGFAITEIFEPAIKHSLVKFNSIHKMPHKIKVHVNKYRSLNNTLCSNSLVLGSKYDIHIF